MHQSAIEVAIIGAGPYGLSLATHLQKRRVEHRIFGSPMQTWRELPQNMSLKSLGFASSIPTPDGSHTFPEFCHANNLEDYEPIEYANFARYGMEFQRELVPYVENTKVTHLTREGAEFELTLESGETVRARRVVVAIGLHGFARLPDEVMELPSDRVNHTWQFKTYDQFADRDVVVVGGGSSALERAALLHEHGARVRVIVRREVHWGGRGPREWERSLIDRIKMPLSVLGHGRENWMLEHFPYLPHFMPTARRLKYTQATFGPAAAWWLRPRVEGQFPVQQHTALLRSRMDNEKVRLTVSEQGVGEYDILADHVVAGTGYAINVDSIAFLDPALAADVARWDDAPRLSRHFESSVNGLYFLGPIAANSFGPLLRFVAGADFAVKAISGHVARTARKSMPVSQLTPSQPAVNSPQVLG